MTRVKICGIQRLEDALAAAQAGADYVGLVFVPQRRRRLTLEAGKAIVDGVKAAGGRRPQVVGLFADQPLAEVNDTIRECGLDLVQLCGSESLDYCRQVDAAVIKVLHVGNPTDLLSGGDENPPNPPLQRGARRLPPGPPEAKMLPPFAKGGQGGFQPPGQDTLADLESRLRQYRDAGCLVTLDRQVEGLQGGTGQSFDWRIAAALARKGHKFLLAGGLTPGNVAQAIADVQPWGVDVSSGVETNGVKDPEKIRDFIRYARGQPSSRPSP
jgi:phosphoribosylanthranilate isomerase